MDDVIRLVGPHQAVELLGVRLVGVTADNGKKLIFTVVLIVVVLALEKLARRIARSLYARRGGDRPEFWTRQAINIVTAVVVLLGLLSIWFEDAGRLTTAMGLVTAGLAFALQRVVTAVAGYFVILRGQTFNVGDRISMGGVRGDVIALGFMQTTIMEMGQPPAVQNADPAMWLRSREYSGRIVTVTNAKIFDEPVYNYSRDFPYIWEEMVLPIGYSADRAEAERLLLAAVERHATSIATLGEQALAELARRSFVATADTTPRVYWRLTDNWLELTVRFLVEDHGIRRVKDAITRDLLRDLDDAGIEVASATVDVVHLPTLRVEALPVPTGPAGAARSPPR